MPASQKRPLSYEAVAAELGATAQVPLGVRPIRVKRIVGSAGKADKIGPDFLPLGTGPASGNYRAVLLRMKAGDDLPPITVYQVGNRYFVVDGHTRTAAAKALGIEYIDANVTEVLPRREGSINLTYYARKEFERATGLQGIRLTAPWRYHLLQHHVEGYRLYLEGSRGREVRLPEAAAVWYRSQYVPTLLEIRRRKLTSMHKGRTTGDIYTDILRAWAEEQGLAVSLREMLDRYDDTVKAQQSPLTRARRRVGDVVEASLPKALSAMTHPDPHQVISEDIDTELEMLNSADDGSMERPNTVNEHE